MVGCPSLTSELPPYMAWSVAPFAASASRTMLFGLCSPPSAVHVYISCTMCGSPPNKLSISPPSQLSNTYPNKLSTSHANNLSNSHANKLLHCLPQRLQAIWYFACARFLYEDRLAWSTIPPDMAPGMFVPVVFVGWMNTTGLGLLL
eukprot:scaffold65732_cov22-Tisochrysis_lutea.AAC.1